jgi:8-oxo-dGTP pyrophosphatase MutT (NUDIX family)
MSVLDIAPRAQKMGAGVIPFAISKNKIHFLFQLTFSGRKAGYLIDFGGGVGPGEDYRGAAAREFVEETETMYFSDDISQACGSADMVEKQIPLVAALFEKTLSASPDWCCRRISLDPLRPKRWKTFFVEFPHRDIALLNREWKSDKSGRFKKRRELVWISANELLALYAHNPDRLWTRVRQLENAPEVVDAIRRDKET